MNNLFLYLTSLTFRLLPETRCWKVKRALLRLSGATIGRNVKICSSVSIFGSGKLIIGDNVWVGHRTLLIVSSKILIGNHVNIGPNCFIGTGTHEISPSSQCIGGKGVSKDIIIGDGSWLCAGTSVIAGCSLGEKCVVACGTVVTKDFEGYNLIAGVPGVVKKSYLIHS